LVRCTGQGITDMKWLIAIPLGVANGLLWAFLLACLFKPQLWMALGPMFVSVFAPKAEGRVIRRPRSVAELIATAGGDGDGVTAVIEAFRRAGRNFLMTDPPGPLQDGTEIDVSHEALIRRWQQLSDPTRDPVRNEPIGWMWREFEDGQRWRALAVQARVFRDDRSNSATLSPATTEAYESWWPEHTPAWAARYARDKDLALAEYREIEELWEASKKALEIERKRLQQDAEAAGKRARRTFWALIAAVSIVVVLALVLTAGGFLAWHEEAKRANKDAAQAFRNLGYIAVDHGDSKRALDAYLKALELTLKA
jgi:tetratricopeptide (TPR) repeat protein